MARGKKKESALTREEKLAQVLVPVEEQPYPVPENWCWARIGAISDFERGITFPASAKESELTEDNIPCLRTANVQENLELDDLIYVNRNFIKGNDAKLVRENDIIMSSANSRELVGKSSLVTHVPFPMTFGGFVLNIRAKGIESKYLFYFLRQEFLAGKFMGESTQTTNIANINTTTLGSYELPLPPLEEQQRIVDRIEYLFDKLDEAKEKAQSVLDSFETRKAAILHKAFTGELTAKWRAEHGVSADTWVEKQLIDFLSLITYGFTNPMPDADEGPWKITAKSVHDGYIDYEVSRKTTQEAFDNLLTDKSRPLVDDVLLTKDGSIGRVAVVDRPSICINQSVALLRPNEKIHPEFLRDMLLSPQHQRTMELQAGGTALKHIYITRVDKMKVLVPSLAEQEEVCNVVKNLLTKEQQAKEAAEAVLEKIDLLKKSILTRAFRGELGTNDPTEPSALELLKSVL